MSHCGSAFPLERQGEIKAILGFSSSTVQQGSDGVRRPLWGAPAFLCGYIRGRAERK